MKRLLTMLLAVALAFGMTGLAQAQPSPLGGEQVYIEAPDNPGIPAGSCQQISSIVLGLSGNVTLVAGDTGQFNLGPGISLCRDIDFFVGNHDARLTVGLGPASGPTGNGRFGPIELFKDIEASGGNGVYMRVRGGSGSSVVITIIGDNTNDWVKLGGGDKELSMRLTLFDRALWTYNNTKFASGTASGWLFEDLNGNGEIISGDGDRPVTTPTTTDKYDGNAVYLQTPANWASRITASFESQDILNPGVKKWDFTNDPGFASGDSTIFIAYIRPLAEFTATPGSGGVPLTVFFTDQSSGSPTSWSWLFGDGGTSSDQHPSHTYTTAGTYTVVLTASNAYGSGTEIKNDYLTVYDVSTNASGNISTDTTWTLSNSPYIVIGTVQILEGVTLTIEPGVTVKFNKDTLLRIGGELIAEGAENQMIMFTSNEIAPDFQNSGRIDFVEAAVGSTLDENCGYVDGSIIEYCQFEYSLGIDSDVGLYIANTAFIHNGGISIRPFGTIVNNTFDTGGGISILSSALNTTCITANTIMNSSSINVNNAGTCSIIENTMTNSGGINVNNTGTCSIVGNTMINTGNMNVDNDGTCSIAANTASGIYVDNSGTCSVNANTASSMNANNSGTFTIFRNDFAINSEQEYGIHISNSGICDVTANIISGYPEKGIEIARGPCVISGNNLLSSGQYKLYNDGLYDITATNNWWGTTNILEIEERIYDYYDNITKGEVIFEPFALSAFPTTDTAPIAAFSATPLSGNAPLTVSFADQSVGLPTSWLWDFGDGWTSTEQNPSHTYTAAGSYTVSLAVSKSPFSSDTEVKTDYITVLAPEVPVADFTASPRSGDVPLTVQFTDQSGGFPTFWIWDFGTEIASSEQHPNFTFTYPGTFTVSLTASNDYGSDTETKTDYITVYSCGDHNRDGVVNLKDLFDNRDNFCREWRTWTQECWFPKDVCGDYNEDEVINLRDWYDKRAAIYGDFKTWIQQCWLAERRGSADMDVAEELMREFSENPFE